MPPLSIHIASDAHARRVYPRLMPKRTVLGWGPRFRYALKAKGLTVADVAEKIGRAESSVRSWLNGNREINLSEFIELCASARLEPAAVLSDDSEGHDFINIALAWRKSKGKQLQRELLLMAAKGILSDEDRGAGNGEIDTGRTAPRRRL
jgi:transcriptional regulator with XRE-family HTH domain